MNKTLVALAGIAAFLVIAFLAYDLLAPKVNQCEGIFQQTAPGLEANIKILETEGGVILGRKQVQELSDHAQEIALNLKSCCVMAGSGNLDQFNQCKESAVLYDQQMAAAAETVRTVAAATGNDQAQKQKEAEDRLAAIIQSANAASSALQKQVNEISAKQPDAPRSDAGAPQGPGSLRLQAALTKGGDLAQACFEIYEPKQDPAGNRRQIARSCAQPATLELPAGPYVVVATSGNATAQSDLTVTAGQVNDQIVDLNAGYLRTRAELAAGGEQVRACFEVYEPKEDLQGNHKQVARTCGDKALFTLPVGDYLLNAQAGQALASSEMKITAGAITDLPIVLNAGYLRSYAELTSGGEQVRACFEVYDPKEDVQGNRKQITRACDMSVLFTLPAGEYLLKVQSGDASTSVDVKIDAGQPTKLPVDLKAGYLRAQAQFAGENTMTRACFEVYESKQDVQGNRKQINRTCTDKAVFTLPAGNYVLLAQSGDTSAEQAINVTPGGITDQLVTLPKP